MILCYFGVGGIYKHVITTTSTSCGVTTSASYFSLINTQVLSGTHFIFLKAIYVGIVIAVYKKNFNRLANENVNIFASILNSATYHACN